MDLAFSAEMTVRTIKQDDCSKLDAIFMDREVHPRNGKYSRSSSMVFSGVYYRKKPPRDRDRVDFGLYARNPSLQLAQCWYYAPEMVKTP